MLRNAQHHRYGAELDCRSTKDWTPLSYSKAKGKYGPTEEQGIYPEVCTHQVVRRRHYS